MSDTVTSFDSGYYGSAMSREMSDTVTSCDSGYCEEAPCNFIEVLEGLLDYLQKKKYVDSLETTPRAQQLPPRNQLEAVPHISEPVNTNLTTGNPQVVDAQTQTKSEISNSESATERSSDTGDSEDNHDSYSDDDDEDDPIHCMGPPQHKLDLSHMLGYDTPGFVRFTTNSCSGVGSSSGSGSGNSNNSRSGKATSSPATTNSSGPWTPATQPGTANDSPGDNILAIDSSIPQSQLAFKPLDLKCWHAACGFRCPGNKTGTSTEVRRLLEYVLPAILMQILISLVIILYQRRAVTTTSYHRNANVVNVYLRMRSSRNSTTGINLELLCHVISYLRRNSRISMRSSTAKG
jgi:hypothetical protein